MPPLVTIVERLSSPGVRSGTAERGQDVELRPHEAVFREDHLELALDRVEIREILPTTPIGAGSRSGRSRRHCAVIRSTASLRLVMPRRM